MQTAPKENWRSQVILSIVIYRKRISVTQF